MPSPRPAGSTGRDLAHFQTLIFDAVPDAAAVIERSGTIVAVNRAWRMFSLDQGGTEETTGVGVNYLDACARAAAAGCDDAVAVIAGLRATLDGLTIEYELEYACPSPEIDRWFVLRLSALGDPVEGVLASHVNITRRMRAERGLAHEASHDPLTGLANRTLLGVSLAGALLARPGRPARADVGVLYIDLDGFKAVNDQHGHVVGDEVLRIAAARLRSLSRAEGVCARIGGDEFVVIVPRVMGQGLDAVAARMRDELARPYQIHGRPMRVGASIGSYLAGPGTSVTEALHRADMAMYAVKRVHHRGAESQPATA